MRIDIIVEMDATGLVGGDREWASHLGAWTSFGRYREAMRIPLVVKGDTLSFSPGSQLTYTIDLHKQPYRGDESVWFRLYCNTRYSGVPDIDKTDKAYVVRTVYSGDLQVTLAEMLAVVDPNTGRGELNNLAVLDGRLASHLRAKYQSQNPQRTPNMQCILEESFKANTKLSFTISDIDRDGLVELKNFLSSIHQTARAGEPLRNATGALLYVPDNYRYFSEGMNRFLETYCNRYMGRFDPKTGNIIGKPCFDAATPGVQGLQFAVYRAPVGMLPVIAFWTHQSFLRPWATGKEKEEALSTYESTAATENYYEVSLRAACRRYGMEPDDFIAAVQRQYARVDTVVNPDFVLAKCIAVDVGTFIANAIYYSTDMRYKNAKRPRPVGVSDDDFNRPEEQESFDLDGMMLMSNDNDCEDEGNAANSVSRVLAHAREVKLSRAHLRNGKWKSPLLNAAKMILDDCAFLDVGGDVTAKYVKADGTEMKKGEIKNLPLKDSEEDRRNATGGHAYGLVASLARLHVWASRRGTPNAAFTDKVRAIVNRAPWQYRVPTLVCEGTGAVDHTILPAAELFGGSSLEIRKAEAARVLVRETLVADEYKMFTETFRAYSTPFYSNKVEANRRITGFYRNAVHAGCAETYVLDHGLSQLSFVDPVAMKRGVDLAVILRDSINDPSDQSAGRIAVDFPFAEMTKEWDTIMLPIIEAQVNQMPITSLQSIARLRAVRPYYFGVMTSERLGKHLLKTKESGELSTSLVSDILERESGPLLAASLSASFGCGVCGGKNKRKSKKGKKNTKKLVSVDDVSIANNIFAACTECGRTGTTLHGNDLSTMSKASFMQSAPFSASLGNWVTALDRSPIASGNLDWARVTTAAARLTLAPPLPLLDSAHSMAPVDDIPVAATIVEFECESSLSPKRCKELMAAQATAGWSLFTRNPNEKWVRLDATASPYRVTGVCFAPTLDDGTIRVLINIDGHAPTNASVKQFSRERRLALIHLSVMGRIYALHPIILAVGNDVFLTDISVPSRPTSAKVSIVKNPIPSQQGLCVQLAIRGESEFAQAFCTMETLEARPWVTSESAPNLNGPVVMNHAQDKKLDVLLSQNLSPLEYHTGLESELPRLEMFRNCYKRSDVVIVRFVARDWSVRKNYDTVLKTLSQLYTKGEIIAHEFAVATPLPQCDDIVELHLLCRVK